MPATKFVDRNTLHYPATLWLLALALSASLAANLFAQTSSPRPEDDKKTANNLYLAGLALAKDGKLEAAIIDFDKAVEADSTNTLLLNAAGAVYSLKGDLKRAKEYFIKCLQFDPGFVQARKNLAITYFAAGEYDLAAAQFQKFKETSPASAAAADLFLGMIAEKKSNHAQAESWLEASATLLDQYPEAILSLARAALYLTHVQKAREALAKLDALHGITPSQQLEASDLYSELAHTAQKNGDLALALQSLRRAAQLAPAREDNYLDFSSICADGGNYPLALEGADIGLEHIPNSYRLLVQKGVVLENLARFVEAQNILRQASRLRADNSVALLSLAIVQTHAGQIENAQATLASALKQFPDDYYMHYHLGKLLLQAEEANPNDSALRTEAMRAFEDAIRCNPSYADSYYQLSKFYLQGTPKLAEQNLVKCLRLDPNHAPAEYSLARLYLRSGRRKEGQALIDRFERQRQADKVKENQKPRIELARN